MKLIYETSQRFIWPWSRKRRKFKQANSEWFRSKIVYSVIIIRSNKPDNHGRENDHKTSYFMHFSFVKKPSSGKVFIFVE